MSNTTQDDDMANIDVPVMELTTPSVPPLKNPISKIIKERSAELVSGGHVFYNPVQEFNRDLSISVLNVYFRRLIRERAAAAAKKQKGSKRKSSEAPNGEHDNDEKDVAMVSNSDSYVAGEKYDDGLRILEALSATGLRSIRYAKEIVGVREIVANDLSKKAVESIEENVKHNGVEHLVRPSHADATTLMYQSTAPEKQFDVIDLDPYGCPNRFLDGAVQCIADGGLLLVTATDMAVLAGNAPEACFVKYGSVPLRMKSCHEMALRILLHCIEAHANRYGKYIEPLLSISADFYIRIFVRVHTSQARCKYSMSKQSMIYQCTGCDTFTLQPLGIIKPNPTETSPQQVKFGIPTGPAVGASCEHCTHKHHLGGPLWSHPIHDKAFVQELVHAIEKEPLSQLGTQRRLIGMLSVVLEELDDVPLYYVLDKMCCVLKLEIVPILKFRSALLHAGYRVSFSHASKNSIKTDAPPAVLWDILRCWNKEHPVKEERKLQGTATKIILDKPCEGEYKFHDIHPQANPYSRRNALSRFQENPAPHWGPGTRATMMIGEDKIAKSFRNQNRKQKQRTKPSADIHRTTDDNHADNDDDDNDVQATKHAKLTE